LLEGTNSEAIRIAGALVVRSENAHGRRSTSAVNCAAFAADAYYEADHLAQARDVLAHRLDLLRLSSPEPMIRALITRNRLSALQLSPQEVLSSLAEDETQCRKQALDRPLAYLLAEQGRLQLLLGHKEAAQALQTELDALAERHGAAAGFLAEIVPIAALAGTRLALANGNAEAALAEIRKLRQHGIAFARQKSIVLADLLSGRAFDLMGRDAQSRHCLITGIDAARQLGLVRTILDEGAELQVLLKRLLPTLDAGSMREYLADIFRRADAATASQLASNEAAAKARGQVLKPREIEILKLLGHSMSNKRIALTLNITLETVKWNLKNIFGKLNAPSRYHAVMIARKHGLID
jgi:LuxR family maltose regulon positive regulatory protein